MLLIVPIAEWLERHAGKQEVAGSIPGGGIFFILISSLISRCSQLSEAYTNDIKHDIRPE